MKGKYFIGFYIGPATVISLYFLYNLPLLDSICYFFLTMLFTRIIFKKEINDYLFCYILSLVCLFIAAMGTAELSFAFIFTAFFIVISWSMIFYQLRVDREIEITLMKTSLTFAQEDEDYFKNEKVGGAFFGYT